MGNVNVTRHCMTYDNKMKWNNRIKRSRCRWRSGCSCNCSCSCSWNWGWCCRCWCRWMSAAADQEQSQAGDSSTGCCLLCVLPLALPYLSFLFPPFICCYFSAAVAIFYSSNNHSSNSSSSNRNNNNNVRDFVHINVKLKMKESNNTAAVCIVSYATSSTSFPPSSPSVPFDLPPFLFHLPLRAYRATSVEAKAALCSRRVRYFITSRSICHAGLVFVSVCVWLSVCVCTCLHVRHNSISAPVLLWWQCLHRLEARGPYTAMHAT